LATGGWNEKKNALDLKKKRFFLATGGWNENKNALDLKNVSFWLLVDRMRTKNASDLKNVSFWLLVDGMEWEQKCIRSERKERGKNGNRDSYSWRDGEGRWGSVRGAEGEKDGIGWDGVFSMPKMYNVDAFGLSVVRPWGNSGGEVTPLLTDIPLPTHTLCTLYITLVVGKHKCCCSQGGWKRI
jgi:hypothetical protein